jgi:uncharacterized protein (UPF0548 family)
LILAADLLLSFRDLMAWGKHRTEGVPVPGGGRTVARVLLLEPVLIPSLVEQVLARQDQQVAYLRQEEQCHYLENLERSIFALKYTNASGE